MFKVVMKAKSKAQAKVKAEVKVQAKAKVQVAEKRIRNTMPILPQKKAGERYFLYDTMERTRKNAHTARRNSMLVEKNRVEDK